jgi:pimeloyl-ACP methyl ester carboxylesterase
MEKPMPNGDDHPAKPPRLGLLLRELIDLPILLAAPFRAAQRGVTGGGGQPVLVLPGFLSNDAPTSLLRRSIDAAGMKSFGWEMGINAKIKADTVDRLKARLDAVVAASGGAKVTLVGWSLGGLFARQLANAHPDNIRMVVTLGSPFSGDVRANNAWRLIELVNGHPIDAMPLAANFSQKPPVHTIAGWSPNDGIIAPPTARGLADQSEEQIEFSCTHLGFCASAEGVSEVVKLLAERL